MNKSIKFSVILVLAGLIVFGCQEDDKQMLEPLQKSTFYTPIGSNIEEGDFDIIPWLDNSQLKSTTNYDFIDGGMVMIEGQFLKTVIIGNQRWTTIDFKGNISDSNLSVWDNLKYGKANHPDTTIYYSYNLAMTLNGSQTMMSYNAPAGLVETSAWRIPTWTDENELHHLTWGDEIAINSALEFKPTGMVYHKYSTYHIPTADTISVYHKPTMSIHWNSDFIPGTGTGNGPYGTWQLVGANCVDYIYGFQFQLMMPYAPIRLVQNIEPIQ